jgi:hypothetical protein
MDDDDVERNMAAMLGATSELEKKNIEKKIISPKKK